MPPVLLLMVTDLIVKLFQIIFESNNLVLSGADRVNETGNIFIPLNYDLFLMSNASLCRFDLRLDTLN